jgi:hypothetical protein
MYSKTSERSEQGYIFAPGELVEHPVGRGTEGVFARSGGALLWVLSCRDKKVPRLRVREPDSNTRAKPAPNKKPPSGGFINSSSPR